MSKNAKTCLLLVLFLLLTVLVPHSSANDGHEVNQIVSFDQVDGLSMYTPC